AAYDIGEAYQATVAAIERELASHARVIAEQTARSFQAVDVQLRHLEQQHRQGVFARLPGDALRAYLREQAVGLVQADGLVVVNPDGRIRATSYLTKEQEAIVNVSDTEIFRSLSSSRGRALFIGAARQSQADARWMFPTGRRVESPAGEFLGVVA